VYVYAYAGRRSRRGGQRVAKSALALEPWLLVWRRTTATERQTQRSLRRRVCGYKIVLEMG
jgi:hypothetical protein